eukprot:TRINITY_DN3020_c1_g1_i1.p1 TRINITY_DN3020_c1_g1~~TRINITY_DN3020_c1_g1_i1.p1  ORF type:complete len:326 (-),score=63.20 TRINITY_DN3020_c1_g1_i1:108-1085(-)
MSAVWLVACLSVLVVGFGQPFNVVFNNNNGDGGRRRWSDSGDSDRQIAPRDDAGDKIAPREDDATKDPSEYTDCPTRGGTFLVEVEQDFPPYNYRIDGADGTVSSGGYALALITQVAQLGGFPVEFIVADWQQCLQGGDLSRNLWTPGPGLAGSDFVACSAGGTLSSRSLSVDFSVPIGRSPNGRLMVRLGATSTNLNTNAARVGFESNQLYGFELLRPVLPNVVNYIPYTSIYACKAALLANNVDACFTGATSSAIDGSVALWDGTNGVQAPGGVIATPTVAVLFGKQQKCWLNAFNAALAKLNLAAFCSTWNAANPTQQVACL